MDKQLLIDARDEINRLRRTNEILEAKVEMIDLFACVLNTKAAHRPNGATEDVVWHLDNAIDTLDAAQAV